MTANQLSIDRSAWGRLRITGSDRVRFLQGLTTVNLERLAAGDHGWGAILNPKGRVLSVIDVARTDDSLIVTCEPRLTVATRALLERYAVMDEVEFASLDGPAHQVWSDVASVWSAPFVAGAASGAIGDDDLRVERLRIAAGFVRYGADVDDDHFPFETPLANFLDYQKGCYVGQEPVFRVHAQGNAARALRGLWIDGGDPVAAGTPIAHPARPSAGSVTSAVVAEDGSHTIALGYLHRSCWDVDGRVSIDGRSAIVRGLPMALALAVATVGCNRITDSFEINEFSGDPLPIRVETASGAAIAGLRDPATDEVRTAVIDVLSPLTLIDPGAGVATSVVDRELLLLGLRSNGALDVPRARLRTRVVSTHPCANEQPTCTVGAASAPRGFDAIVGADALAGDALRLRLGDDQVFLLADVAGDEQERLAQCDAVFPSPYRGGGTLVLGGTELPFGGRRIAIAGCLGPDASPAVAQAQRGTDVLFVVSTAIGASLLGEGAYERYRQIRPTAPPLDALPADAVSLPSGPIAGRRTTIDRMMLVARSSATPRAACRHAYAHPLLLARDCEIGDDCPCDAGSTFCALPAMVDLAPPGGLDILIVPDTDPTLEALRTELRPDQAQVDGILGTGALATVELDVDYPHARVLARCTATGCTTRPALPDREARAIVSDCLAR